MTHPYSRYSRYRTSNSRYSLTPESIDRYKRVLGLLETSLENYQLVLVYKSYETGTYQYQVTDNNGQLIGKIRADLSIKLHDLKAVCWSVQLTTDNRFARCKMYANTDTDSLARYISNRMS